jgi:acyl-CoA hydrolase
LEVEVNVEAEDLDDNTRVHTGTAFVTTVALDKYGKSTEVPPLIIENDDDKKRFHDGESRMLTRLKDAGRER